MSTPLRIDWVGLLNRIEAAGENPAAFCLVCLPTAGRHLLLASMERLEWEATYRIEGYDYSDFEDIIDYVEDTKLALANCGETMTSVEITELIEQKMIQTAANQGVCCYTDGQLVNDAFPELIFPLPDDRDDLCIYAQKAHDNGRSFLEEIFNYGTAGGAISAGVLAVLLAGFVLAFPLSLVFSLIGFLVKAIGDVVTDEIEQDWIDLKPDIVCAIYTSVTPALARFAVHDIIDTASINELSKSIFKSLYNQDQMNKIFNGEVGSVGGYLPSYCTFCDDPPATWSLTWTFDEDAESWSLGSGVTYQSAEDNIRINVSSSGTPAEFKLSIAAIWSLLGLTSGTPIGLYIAEWIATADGLTMPANNRLNVRKSDGGIYTTDEMTVNPGESIEVSLSTPQTLLSDASVEFHVQALRNGGAAGNFVRVDTIRFFGFTDA